MPVDESIAARAVLGERLAGAVREAGALALTKFQAPLESWTKDDHSPVTEADIAVDDLLRRRLTAAAPDCAWFSEESTNDPARIAARRLWIVDPIDGTRAFLAGRSDWAISVALVADGRPIIAALFAPVEAALYVAVAGAGATLNGTPITATGGGGLDNARVAGPKSQLERLAAIGQRIDPAPRVHSMALRIARVAQGALDAAFTSGSGHDWDLAAADLLVHEAGGALTTIEGRILTYNCSAPVHGTLVAAGRARHATLVELMRSRLGEFA